MKGKNNYLKKLHKQEFETDIDKAFGVTNTNTENLMKEAREEDIDKGFSWLMKEVREEAQKLINEGLTVGFDEYGHAKINIGNPHFNIIYASAFEQGAQFIINRLNGLEK